MGNLDTVPSEIISMILKDVEPNDYANIASTSKSLRRNVKNAKGYALKLKEISI